MTKQELQREELRKCIANGSKCWFHCWAGLSEEAVGIVEDEYGRLKNIPFHMIRFEEWEK